MSIVDDFTKLAQSFLTLDDLVLGQSLVEGGIGQLGQVGLSASGPSTALNVAARAIYLGAQVGTKSAEKAADTVTGIIPLAEETKALAGKAADQAKALGERCSSLAVHGIELAAGRKPQNPLTKQEWLDRQTPPGYTAGELAADTTFGSLQGLAMMPFDLGMDLFRMATGGVLGDTMRKGVDASFDAIPGETGKLDAKALRGGLFAVAMGSGMPVVQGTVALTDAVARLAFTDSRALHRVLTTGLEQARLLADQDLEEPVPGVPISSSLRDMAKLIVDNPPETFMAALEKGADGEAPGFAAILSASLSDSRALAIFLTLYPQVLGLLGSDVSMLLADGLADSRGTKAYIDKEGSGRSTVFSMLDSLIGGAVTEDDESPLFSRATVYLAQDLSFGAYRDVHGRAAALQRVEDLFGEDVRERVENDVSLDSKLMETEGRQARDERLRSHIKKITDTNALSRQVDHCVERLALMEGTPYHDAVTMTGVLNGRVEVLRSFTSLAATDLALRGAPVDGATEARNAFLTWATAQL